MMRQSFDSQLKVMHTGLIAMGALCETAIAAAAKALLEGEPDDAQKALLAEQEIDGKEREMETLCLKLLLQQQPVAGDLRQVSAALKMITDMERIGDQAADIAEISAHIEPRGDPRTFSVREMAQATISMVTNAIDSFVRQDLGLARMVMRQDDKVDTLFNRTRDEIVALIAQAPGQGAYALDLLMTAKYFERIGDHAVNIAEWVEFSITGEHGGYE